MKLALYILVLGVPTAWGLLRSPFVGALACVLAYLLNPVVFGEEEIRYQLFTNVAFLVSFFLHGVRPLKPVGREGMVLWLFWFFIGFAALSSVWAVVNSQIALETTWEVAKTVLFASMLACVIRTERELFILLITCILGVWHAAVLHTFGVYWSYVLPSFSREFGVLPDSHGSVLIMFVPLMILLAMMGDKKERILCCCALPFVLNSVVVLYQRTYFVCLLCEAGFLLLFLPLRITVRVLPVLVVGVALFVGRLAPEDYWTWMGTIANPDEEASAHSRMVLTETSWQVFRDHPAAGVGYRNYPDVSPSYLDAKYLTEGRRAAHNSFWTVLCETGLGGFIPWAGAFVWAIWLLRRIRRGAEAAKPARIEVVAMGLEIGLYGWIIGGCFQADHEVDPAYWFAALAVMVTRLHRKQKELGAERQIRTDSEWELAGYPEEDALEPAAAEMENPGWRR